MISRHIRIMSCEFIAKTDNAVPHCIAGSDKQITGIREIFIGDIRKLIKIFDQIMKRQIAVQTGREFVLCEE